MVAWLGAWAAAWHWWILAAAFLGASAWETMSPERPHDGSLGLHWIGNLALAALCALLAGQVHPWQSWLAPATEPRGAFAVAALWGGEPAVLLPGILLLDLYAYASHRLQHAVFPLWRLHAVHHSDEQVNASTAVRHHLAIFVANGAAGACLEGALGLPLWVLPIYGALSTASNVVSHMNARLPRRAEAVLQRVLVTPQMHRLHHSDDPAHYGSNFGNLLAI